MGFLGGLLGGGGGAGGILNMVGGILGGLGKSQGAGGILQAIGGALGNGGNGGGDLFGMISNLLQGILGRDQAAMTPAGQPSQLGLGG